MQSFFSHIKISLIFTPPHPPEPVILSRFGRPPVKSILAFAYIGRTLACLPENVRYQEPRGHPSYKFNQEYQKALAKKLDLIKRLRFLPKDVLSNFYCKVILPSVTYGFYLWASCFNADPFDSLERLHSALERQI